MRQSVARCAWLLLGLCAATAASTAALSATLAAVAGPQGRSLSSFTPFTSDPRKVLEGNWYSCRESDGQYGERVYDHVVNGGGKFEVHLGPRREFALFKGVQDEHRDHESSDNLLKPYRVAMDAGRAKQRWDVPSLNLVFTVTLAGGSRTDCESWFIVLEQVEKTSH